MEEIIDLPSLAQRFTYLVRRYDIPAFSMWKPQYNDVAISANLSDSVGSCEKQEKEAFKALNWVW